MKFNKNTFVYKTLVLVSSNFLLQLLALFYRILLGRLIPPDALGIHTLVMQLYAVIMSFCVYGLCNATANLSAQFHGCDAAEQIPRLIRMSFLLFFALFILLALPLILFRRSVSGLLLGDPQYAGVILLLLCCIFLTGIENILKAVFTGLQIVRIPSLSEISELAIRIAAVFFLIAWQEPNPTQPAPLLLMAGMTMSELFSVCFLLLSYRKHFPLRSRSKPQRNRSLFRQYLSVAFPSAATFLSANLFSSLATILLPQRLILSGMTQQAAVSALGILSGKEMPLFILPGIVIGPVSTLLMTDISTRLAARQTAAAAHKIQNCVQLTGLIAIPFTAALIPLLPALCEWLFHCTIPENHVWLLALQSILSCYLAVFISILNGLSLQRQVLRYTLLTEAIQFFLIYFLSALPQLEIIGYLIGILCSDFLRLLLLICKTRAALPSLRFSPFSCLLAPLITGAISGLYARFLFTAAKARFFSPISAVLISVSLCLALYFVLIHAMGVDFSGSLGNALHKESGHTARFIGS